MFTTSRISDIYDARYRSECTAALHNHTPMKAILDSNADSKATRFRVSIQHGVAIGPGKADVLEGIAATGSLAETGRRLSMSYQRVWTLVNAMNEDFIEPLVTKQRGGSSRGGAQLTETGERVLALYRATEHDAMKAVNKHLPAFFALLREGLKP